MNTALFLAAQAATAAPAKAAAAIPSDAMKAATPTITSLIIANAFNFVVAILILLIGWMLATFARRWIRLAFTRYHHLLDPSLGPILASLARYSILFLTIIAVLGRFGVEMTSLIAVVGAAGIAVGLALQGTLANVAAGMMILLLRPFRVGDMISILGTEGTRGVIKEIGLFRTLVTSVEYKSLSFPNSTVFNGTIVNYSQEDRFRIDITVPVDQLNDLGTVRSIFLDEVKKNERVFKTPAPVIGVADLGEYSVTMLVRFWVDYPYRNVASWDIRQALHDRMRAEGIAIPVARQAPSARYEADLPGEITGLPAPTNRDTRPSASVNRIRPSE
jgi:small conductance mechanosensitive channel